ncbi:unnamed protein product [Schistosoma curassoni]|uniref:Uncharacterized protein n=1 Tax=Schistosoma curassoni TaxID=6186 RepID=A0A183L4Y0_9TREM|nr:unnamed protein product [Schistosoma curassoni]
MFLTLCDFGYGFNEVLKPHKSVPPFIEKMKKRYNLRNKQPIQQMTIINIFSCIV